MLQLFKGVKGRVLHTRCGSGDLVSRLQKAVIDAYGVDSDSTSIAIGTGGDVALDLRPDDERAHMRNLVGGALSGIVFSGSVDILPVGAQIDLVDLAAVALAPGAKIAIVTTNPKAWTTSQSLIASDLAPGRPLHAETWAHLLTDRGFTVERVQGSPHAGALMHVPGGEEHIAAMNANIDLLNDLLYPPASSIVIARR